MDELLEIVDPAGRVLGTARRRRIHGDPSLLHRVVHVIVENHAGEILLQKRSAAKDVAPGRWDTSVGGHVAPGETIAAAVSREMAEELGIAGEPEHLYTWTYRSARESELVYAHRLLHEGPFRIHPGEIDEVRFWPPAGIERALGTGVFSRQFEEEYARYRDWRRLAGR